MKNFTPVLITAVVMAPTLTSPQGLVRTTNQEFDVCQQRPLQPEWIGNLPSRDAFRGAVIQMIYRAESYRRVIDAGECACETRFPSWDSSIQLFNDKYLGSDRNGLRDARNEYRAQANEMHEATKALCEEAGNW